MQENVIFWQKLWSYISLDYHSCFAMAVNKPIYIELHILGIDCINFASSGGV